MSDLVRQLEKAFEWSGDAMLREAADEITALRARLAEVEKGRDEAKESARWAYIDGCLDGDDDAVLARAERAEAALATARRDALERAAVKARDKCLKKGEYALAQACYDAIRALAKGDKT